MSAHVDNVSVVEVIHPSQELHSIAESELEDVPNPPLTAHPAILKHLDTRDSIDSDVSLSYDAMSSSENSPSKGKGSRHHETSESGSEDNVSSTEKDSGCEVTNDIVPSKEDRRDENDEPFVAPDEELINRIVAQVEFYFSDINITKDAFLLKHVKRNKEGYVSLKLISSFKRVKHLAKDWRVVAYALEKSTQLEINEARTKLRRKEPLPPYDQTTPSRTIVAINLPMEKPTIESVAELFRGFGEIALIRIIRPGNPVPADVRSFANKHPEMTAAISALVEFDRTESAKMAVEKQASDWRTDTKCMKVVELNAPPSNERKKRPQPKKSAVSKFVDTSEFSSSCPSSSEAETDLRHRGRRSSSPHLTRGTDFQRRFSQRDSASSDSGCRSCTCCNHCGDRRYSSSGSGYDSPVPSTQRRFSLSREGQEVYQIPMARRYSGTDGVCCNNSMRRFSRDSGSESSGSYTRHHDFSRRFSRDSNASSDAGMNRRFSRDSISSEGSNMRRFSRDSVGSDVFAPPFLSRNNSRDVIDVPRRTSFGSGGCDHYAFPHSPNRASAACGASCSPHMPENIVRMPKGPDGSKGFGIAQSEV